MLICRKVKVSAKELWQENVKNSSIFTPSNCFSLTQTFFSFIIFPVLFVGLIILTFYWALFKPATHG